MKPYVIQCPGGSVTITLDGQEMSKIHDYYEEQRIADILKHAYTQHNDAYCEALAKKVRSLMWNEDLSESEAIDRVIDDFPADDVETFAKNVQEIISEVFIRNLPEGMEDITEIFMYLSERAARYLALPLGKPVKQAMEHILKTAQAAQPVTITGPEDVSCLQKKLLLIKQYAKSIEAER